MDKQIIIDGVDVSGCLFYQTNFEEDFDVKIKHYCSEWHNSCESSNNSNCHYKQLKRKEQECEKLKEEKQGLIKDWEEKKNLAYEIACKNEKLKEENERLKNRERCAWKSLEGSFCPEAQQKLDELKQAEQKLEKIKDYCEEQNLKADWTACEILQIIEE